MRSKLQLLLILTAIAAGAVLIINWESSAQTAKKVVWEYKTYVVQNSATVTVDVNQLNTLGADGWELVESRTEAPMNGITTYRRVEYVFKRIK